MADTFDMYNGEEGGGGVGLESFLEVVSCCQLRNATFLQLLKSGDVGV